MRQVNGAAKDPSGDETRLYGERERAQEVMKGIPEGVVRLFNFSPPHLDSVDYEQAAKSGDNRHAWTTLAHKDRERP